MGFDMEKQFLDRVNAIKTNRVELGNLVRSIDEEKRNIKISIDKIINSNLENGAKSRRISGLNEGTHDLKKKRKYVINIINKLKEKEKAVNRQRQVPIGHSRAFRAAAEMILPKDLFNEILEKSNELVESPYTHLNYTEQTTLIYAARYAHTRKTGASMSVCNEIMKKWKYLNADAKKQIVREILSEAERGELTNSRDWNKILRLAS